MNRPLLGSAPAVPETVEITAVPSPLALTTKSGLLYSLIGAIAFHVAWIVPALTGFTLIYAWCLIQVSRHPSARVAFRLGFLNGMLVFGPHLAWFWNIFGIAAVCLWAVLALFTGAFSFLLRVARARVDPRWIMLTAPVLWTGLEFFRSEIYFLKFSWLAVGYAFSESQGVLPIGWLGVYGSGFVIFLGVALISNCSEKIQRRVIPAAVVSLVILANAFEARVITPGTRPPLEVAGIQLEFPPALEVPGHLDRLLAEHPQAEVFVLSEYTFDSAIPQQVRDWCRQNEKYLIAGGKDDAVPGNFYNTAFVVGPSGEILFKQVKSVPIQFFADGLPAPAQEVWDSPWGKIAIPVCYDLSYRSVMDPFIRRGAQAIIVPFMDVIDWGAQQHELHTRIAPVRAREYKVPVFRVGSSGISQHVDATGQVLGTLPFPGQEEIIAASLHLPASARLPIDHWLAPACAVLTGCFVLMAVGMFLKCRFLNRPR